MSRVEDDRDEARRVEQLMQLKRAEEARKTNRVSEDSTFARLVTQAKDVETLQQQDFSGRSAIKALLNTHHEEVHGVTHAAEQHDTEHLADDKSTKGRLGAHKLGEKLVATSRTDGRRTLSAKTAGDNAANSRSSDKSSSSRAAAGRDADAKVGRDSLAERATAADKASDAQGDQHGDTGIKTDADKGGGGKQSGGGGGDKKGDVPANFKFNPALMAPPPIAKQSNLAGSDRLRRIASEVAQKIVERVRIGTNAMGNAEFQIDLRSNVLSGLQVKVSAKNGRISAIFSGSDKEVLRMLEEQEEALKGALSSRGLTLEKFKVEAKA